MTTWQELFHGPNFGFVLELYERYQKDPQAVDEVTRAYFDTLGQPPETVASNGAGSAAVALAAPPATSLNELNKVVQVSNLVTAIREYGHLAAHLDPLGVTPPPGDPALDPANYNLSEEDLKALPASLVGGPVAENVGNAYEAIEALRRVYSASIGYDYDHVRIPEERDWLRQAAESRRFSPENLTINNNVLLTQLTRIEAFEQFCHRTFPGKTRFSIEGLDMMVPILTRIIGWVAGKGYSNISLGMAHRGRLNVMAHLLYKNYAIILTEFKDPLRDSNAETGWSGDVLYHAGEMVIVNNIHPDFLNDDDETIDLTLSMAPNPSHLEHVNPVVLGMARAAGTTLNQPGQPHFNHRSSLPILIHGDASFTGQGIVTETLNMHRLPGYTTGGAIHIIANNQLGFTTDPDQSRSTLYASDVAKGYKIPVIHVNADDPEACLEAARTAADYLATFHKDFVIDLIGYRRWGHNEGDEPRLTQPKLYSVIENHPTVRDLWAKTLVERGEVNPAEAAERKEKHLKKLEDIYENSILEAEAITPTIDLPPEGAAKRVQTKVDLARLQSLNQNLLNIPAKFNLFSGLKRIHKRQANAIENPSEAALEWGFAETLAFASILADGIPIRLTGEDVGRGTFGHRNAVLHDSETADIFIPLQNLAQAQAAFEIHNSPLTENAAVGFEYGFSTQRPDCMVIWEAQYGDFVNGAQAIIDEFVVSGWAKWNQTSSLVMLLPHGYEGKGPDHSSGRPERFLQLAGEHNIRVANPTTPAQYFHLLRRQAALLKTDPLPLIVMTPKSLLRERSLFSTLNELVEGHWQPVINDDLAQQHPDKVERLIFCSGKIYADLTKHEIRQQTPSVAIARMEQLYAFPNEAVADTLNSYPNLNEVIWMQEEPRNMGAWHYVEPRLRNVINNRWPLHYLGRPRSASPAEGSTSLHNINQAVLVSRAFTFTETA